MKKGRVLVVDDEESIRRAVGRALASRGFLVEVAVDGGEALGGVRSFDPDLVVLDLNLPDVDGLSVCRQIRAWSPVPILVLSVREDETDKVAALDLGADDYLTKPFGTDELMARVRALLRRSGGQGSPGPLEFHSETCPSTCRATGSPATARRSGSRGPSGPWSRPWPGTPASCSPTAGSSTACGERGTKETWTC